MPTPVLPTPRLAIRDALLIDQRIHALAAEPLAIYFALTETASPFAGTASGDGRGYQATWEIRDGRLYLIGIQGTLAGGRPGSLADVFPDFQKRVFAHWFSGHLEAVSPRRAIGSVVLEGIDVPGPTGPLSFDVERGILLAPARTIESDLAESAAQGAPGGPGDQVARGAQVPRADPVKPTAPSIAQPGADTRVAA